MPGSDEDEIRLMDAAVYPSRYIPRFFKSLWSIGKNIVATVALVSVGSVSTVFCTAARASVAAFDALAVRTGRRYAIKDGEKGVSCYSYSPLTPASLRWPPVKLFIQKIVKSDEGPLRASSGAFFYVVVSGSFVEYIETIDTDNVPYVEKAMRAAGSCALISTGDRNKVVLEDGEGACWRIVVSLGRAQPSLTGSVARSASAPDPKPSPPPAARNDEDSTDPLAMDIGEA